LDDGNIPLGGWDNEDDVGRMPQTGLSTVTLWLAGVLNVMAIGALSTLIIVKRNKRKLAASMLK